MRGGGENKTQADRSHVMRIANNPNNQFDKKNKSLLVLCLDNVKIMHVEETFLIFYS